MVSIQLDSSFIIQLINFLLLILVLNYLLYRPIRRILAERKALFGSLKEKAQAAQELIDKGEAEKVRLTTENLRLGLDAKNAMKEISQKEEKALLTKANEDAAKSLEAARAKIQAESQAARQRLEEESKIIAWEMAGKILGRSL